MAGSFSIRCAMRGWRPSPHHPDELERRKSTCRRDRFCSPSGEALQPALEGGPPVGIALEVEVARAEGGEQRVVEPAHRPGWVLVAHPLDELCPVDGRDDLGQ